MILDCFASLRFSFSLSSLYCVLSLLHYAKRKIVKISTFVNSFINQHSDRQTKIF